MTVELVGPHGYTHNWVFHGLPGSKIEDRADQLSHHIGHHTLPAGVPGHIAHLEAARLHRQASKMVSSPEESARHARMAAHHAYTARKYYGVSKEPGMSKIAKPESAAGRREAFKRGLALPPSKPGGPPGFPVTDANHWDRAFQSVGRAGTPARRAALAALLRKTAPMYGKQKKLAGSWAAAGGSKNMASQRRGINLAAGTAVRRQAVRSPADVLVSRNPEGRAVIRHRLGAIKIGEIGRDTDGRWRAVLEGSGELQPHTHQRAALAELIGANNRAAGTEYHRPEKVSQPLQPPAQQTPLMQQFGVPAMSLHLATPADGAGDGPRMTSGSDSGPGGLSPKGVTIYKKLIKRGFPAPRALAFARRAQNFGGKGK